MRSKLLIILLALAAFPIATPCNSGDDPIYDKCKDHPRGPWCYQETVEKIGDPGLCENILKFWPKADGVHGWCYYQLAMKQKKCALCDKIKKADIKKMCGLDVCK